MKYDYHIYDSFQEESNIDNAIGDVFRDYRVSDFTMILGLIERVVFTLASVDKATFGRLLDASGCSRDDLKTILFVADFFDIIYEKDGFYIFSDNDFLYDWLLFFKALKHELWYSHLPKRIYKNNRKARTYKKEIKQGEPNVEITERQNTVRASRERENSLEITQNSRKMRNNSEFFGGNSSALPFGNGSGMRHFEWNDEIALEFYDELQKLREQRKSGDLDDNEFDRFAMK